MHDVYCYGMVSPSLVYVLDEKFLYPRPNEYAEIKQILPSVGGEATNSAIILSKLGLKTKLDGNWINENKKSHIFDLLKPFGIDLSRLTIKQKYGTNEIVITDKNSRTVFGNYASFHDGEKQWNQPNEEDIRAAKILALDPYLKNESLEAAKLCVKHYKPYVTLDCRYDDFIAQNAATVVISHELRDQAYSGKDMNEIFGKYQEHCTGLVIFTFGSDELWYSRKGQERKSYKPYKIEPIDTTGAGDAFRGAICYGLLQKWNDEQVIDFASAVAACVCLTMPHALNAPGLEGVLSFIEKNRNTVMRKKK